MLKKSLSEVPLEDVNIEGAEKIKVQWLFSPKDNVPNFSFRIFHLEPGGCSPRHTHDWEHEVLILEGEGEVFANGEYKSFKKGDVFFIPGGEEHQFISKTSGKFICLIPNSGC